MFEQISFQVYSTPADLRNCEVLPSDRPDVLPNNIANEHLWYVRGINTLFYDVTITQNIYIP